MNTTVGQRIKERRKQLGIKSQKALGGLCGWEDGAARISNYENGIRQPKPIDIKIIARALKVKPEWLQFGAGTSPLDPKSMGDIQESIPDGMVPVIEWDEIRQWVESSSSPLSQTEWSYAISPKPENKRIFALKVKNDAMLGKPKSFSRGGIIFIEPTTIIENATYVVVLKTGEHEGIFRQYIKDGGKSYLKTTNPEYPFLEKMDKTYKIYGKVIRYMDDDLS